MDTTPLGAAREPELGTEREHPPTILVVDDNAATRRFVRATLETERYRVLEADGGAAALEACAAHSPDLIVIDLCMGDMPGTDVISRLQAGGGDVPIIVFTGAPEEVPDGPGGPPCADVIAKPAEPALLLEAVRTHLTAARPHGGDDPRTILLVDGHPARAIRTRVRLRRLGLAVITTGTCAEALDILAAHPVDAIVTDLVPPDRTALELTRAVRATSATTHLPVIVTTGTEASAVQQRLAERAGADAFVTIAWGYEPLEHAVGSAGLTRSLVADPGAASADATDGHASALLRELERHHRARTDSLRAQDRGRAELEVLHDLAGILSGERDLDDVLGDALAKCLHAVGASRGAVYLQEIDGRYSLRSCVGDLDRLPGREVTDLDLAIDRVVRTGKSLTLDTGPPDGRAVRPATVVVPVSAGDERYGALVVEVPAHEDRRVWTQFLELVAMGIGFAVTSARQPRPLGDGADVAEAPNGRDTLTGLAGGRLLHAELTHRVDGGDVRGGTLVLLGIDRLRHVNDTLGRHTGDDLIRGVARCLAAVAPPDTLLARVHGDLFALVAPGVRTPEEASGLAHRLRSAVEAPVRCGPYTLYSTVSVGVAIYPEHGSRSGDLLQAAHTALDLAKERGGNACETYSPGAGAALWQRLSLDQGLRAALERDQFVLHYQPIVELKTARATAAEALLRWDRPLHGLTAASEFVEVAEETGLIVPIGAWVVRTAAHQAAAWQGLPGAPQRIAVNVGAREFHDGRLYDTVAAALDTTGVPAASLSLEITETVALADVRRAVDTIEALRNLGVHTALDDFGTGYSSLRYVQELPVDTLKIDRSFVSSAPTDERALPILAGIVDLAHRLGMSVVAEGIEDEAMLDVVRSLGCDAAQGWHLGRPAPAGALTPGEASDVSR